MYSLNFVKEGSTFLNFEIIRDLEISTIKGGMKGYNKKGRMTVIMYFKVQIVAGTNFIPAIISFSIFATIYPGNF